MRVISLNPTKEKPRVHLDKANNIFEFEGRSRPENIDMFYGPIYEWFEDYKKEPNEITSVVMNFEYFNTSSANGVRFRLLMDPLTPQRPRWLRAHTLSLESAAVGREFLWFLESFPKGKNFPIWSKTLPKCEASMGALRPLYPSTPRRLAHLKRAFTPS